MLKFRTLVFFCLLFIASSASITTTEYLILFENDEYTLTAVEKVKLDQIATLIHSNFDVELSINGHTDNIGSVDYNEKLSAKRAEAVQEYLLGLGVEENIVSVSFHGELLPDAPNTNAQSRGLNRRVVVTLKVYRFENISELNAALKEESTSIFKMAGNKTHVFEGKKGTKIRVEANSFMTEDGSPYDGEIMLEMTEAIDFKDFIANGLTTVSGEEMLQSGGMLNVRAVSKSGKPLQLKPESELTIALPTQNRLDGMERFTSDTGQNWSETGEAIADPFFVDMPKYPDFFVFWKATPTFKRDVDSKPVHPEKRSAPMKPKTPDPLDYIKGAKWYQFFWKKSIEEKQTERYLLAMQKYEKKIERYEYFKGLYDHTMLNYDGNVMAYKDALKQWNDQQVADSIALTESHEYQDILAENQRIYQEAKAKNEIAIKEWKALRRERMGAIADKMDEMGLTSSDMIKSYVTAMSDMTWINIDRFYNLNAKNSRQITLQDNDETSEKVYLVFNKINSMLPVYKDGNNYVQRKFPKKEEVHFFAYKVENGKAYVCYEPVEREVRYELKYEAKTFSELKAILASMQRRV